MTNKTNTRNSYPLMTAVALATHIALQDRFESGAPLASGATRIRLEQAASDLAERIHEMYKPTTVEWKRVQQGTLVDTTEELVVTRHKQNPLLKRLANQLVRLETELGKFATEPPQHEDHSLRRAPWAAAERMDGDTEELRASAEEARREAIALRFKLHAIRKTTIYQIELCKAHLIPPFSWKDAWAKTANKMRELGREARQEDSYATCCDVEDQRREWDTEREATYGVECDSDFNLPTEDSECRRIADEEGRDYRAMSEKATWTHDLVALDTVTRFKCPVEIPSSLVYGGFRPQPPKYRRLTLKEVRERNEKDAALEASYIAEDLWKAAMGG